jgi:hypothetical protein
VTVELSDLDGLFDRSSRPKYPHSGAVVNASVAAFLTDATREQRSRPTVEVVLTFACPPLPPEEEEGTRARFRRFFTNEAELAALDLRVNRTEGVGSLRYALPLVVVAGFLALLFNTDVWPGGTAAGLVAFVYIFFVIVVWVMLWDPIEMLLFDSYLLRMRWRALRKLAAASVQFHYRTGARTAP